MASNNNKPCFSSVRCRPTPSRCLHQKTLLYWCSNHQSILCIFSTLWPYDPSTLGRIWTHCLTWFLHMFQYMCCQHHYKHAWQWRTIMAGDWLCAVSSVLSGQRAIGHIVLQTLTPNYFKRLPTFLSADRMRKWSSLVNTWQPVSDIHLKDTVWDFG